MITKNNQSLLVGALFGSALGIATALLLTPFSGTRTRKKIANGISQINKHIQKFNPRNSKNHTSHATSDHSTSTTAKKKTSHNTKKEKK